MDLAEIQAEVHKLESDRTTWNNCERLAVLYTVLNQHTPEAYAYSSAPEPEPKASAVELSEFTEAVLSVDLTEALKVLNNHMEAVKVIFPKEYSAVISKLRQLNN